MTATRKLLRDLNDLQRSRLHVLVWEFSVHECVSIEVKIECIGICSRCLCVHFTVAICMQFRLLSFMAALHAMNAKTLMKTYRIVSQSAIFRPMFDCLVGCFSD